jgi:hypothetical protein
MKVVKKFLISALMSFTAVQVTAACDLASFARVKSELTCFLKDCRRTSAPDEVKQIERGVYVEFVGLSVNDGVASWIGVNLEKNELFQVNRFAGPHLRRVPTIVGNQNHFLRETKAEKIHWIDVVQKRKLPADALDEIICSANVLWTMRSTPPPFSSDVFNELRLVDGHSYKGIGGMGPLSMPAQEFKELLRSYRDSEWKDY